MKILKKPISLFGIGLAIFVILIAAITIWLRPSGNCQIEISTDTLNLGTIPRSSITQSSFDLKNAGNAPLHIKDIIADCGCTVPSFSIKTLSPHQTTTVKVSFNSEGYWRSIEKHIYIRTDDPHASLVSVKIVGYVRIGIRTDTSELNFGKGVFAENLKSNDLHIIADQDISKENVEITSDLDELKWHVDPWSSSDGDFQEQAIHLEISRLNELPGNYQKHLNIKVGDNDTIPVKINYEVSPCMSAQPARVEFHMQSKSSNAGVLVKIFCPDHAFKIDSVSSSFSLCRVNIQSPPDAVKSFLVFPVDSLDASANNFDVIHIKYEMTGLGRSESLNVPVVFLQ